MNRQLDIKIAKEIYGWSEYEQIPPDANSENEGQVLVPYKGYLKQMFEAGYTLPPKGKIPEGFFVPNYSANFQSAFEVVRKVQLPTPAWKMPTNPDSILSFAYHYFKTKVDLIEIEDSKYS